MKGLNIASLSSSKSKYLRFVRQKTLKKNTEKRARFSNVKRRCYARMHLIYEVTARETPFSFYTHYIVYADTASCLWEKPCGSTQQQSNKLIGREGNKEIQSRAPKIAHVPPQKRINRVILLACHLVHHMICVIFWGRKMFGVRVLVSALFFKNIKQKDDVTDRGDGMPIKFI